MRKIFPTFAILWGLFWVLYAFDYRLWVRRGPGGGFFPLIGGLLTVVFCLLYLKDEIKNPKEAHFSWKFTYPVLAVLGMLMGSYALGLLPCLFLFVFLWLWKYEKYTLNLSLCVALGTVFVLYAVFVFWLAVPLPTGWLGVWIDNLLHPSAF